MQHTHIDGLKSVNSRTKAKREKEIITCQIEEKERERKKNLPDDAISSKSFGDDVVDICPVIVE